MPKSSKNEINFISEFYGKVINGIPGAVHYNGSRYHVSKKEIEKYKPLFTSLEKVIENITPKIHEKKTQEKIGGLLPLALLIPLITGAITGAAAITGGVATAVTQSNENKEQIRHNSEMERIAKDKEISGTGIDNNEDSDDEIEE